LEVETCPWLAPPEAVEPGRAAIDATANVNSVALISTRFTA
jgi:hypothetical protein